MNNPATKKILAVVIGVVVFVGLVFLYFSVFGTRAADFEPRDVVVSNIEKNSVRATWATGVDTQGVVEYGTTPTALNFFAPEATKGKTHSLDLTLLSPNTTYYFDIRVGDKKYDNGGVPWTFTTKGAESSVAAPTSAPTQAVSASEPTPFQRLQISDGTNCTETDCEKIKLLLGKGCSTQDYFLCLKKLTPTP
ncbi:MAG: putative secreted protein containing fibronectin type III-like protein [Candidatus Gottesmanbacteria bacterium GW2011_GWA2_42_18]|uniref:Putative secreted protein containing fibronectin type III-like protein n=1 Tax=Candidatus Gottesmanbacteria bacterium GW2011_GWA2_42_18 TaxID=1618442 RepID=A0A0G0Z8A1_9BACT|nr:MAG: putative secreted protein containing fibronectin type III-like protein [Candidatus Gottesmanbacteria bacterium GW2011_GWA2_42_18]